MLYYLALHERPGGLKFFSFFGGFKITETSQRVRVERQNQCMGCTILYNKKMIEALIEAIGLFFSEFFEKRKNKKDAKKKS